MQEQEADINMQLPSFEFWASLRNVYHRSEHTLIAAWPIVAADS